MSPPATNGVTKVTAEQKPLVSIETGQDVFPREEAIAWMLEWSDKKHGRYQAVCFSLSHVDSKDQSSITALTHVSVPKIGKEFTLLDRQDTIERAASEFWRAAKAHVDSLFSSRQGFIIGAHHESQKKLEDGTDEDPLTVSPRVTFPFPCSPQRGARENFDTHAGSDLEGVVSQLQQIINNQARTYQAANKEVHDRLFEWNKLVMQENTTLLTMREEQTTKREELADRKVTRELEAKRGEFYLEAQAQALDAFIKYGLPLLSVVVKHKLGVTVHATDKPQLAESKAAPELAEGQTQSPLVEYVRALKLTPAQLARFVADMRQDQREQLAPLIQELHTSLPPEEQKELVRLLQEASDREALVKTKAKAKKDEGETK